MNASLRTRLGWAAAGLALLFAALLLPLPSWSRRLGQELENFAHAVAFAGVALGAWALLRRPGDTADARRPLLLAAVLSVGLAGFSELVQPLTGRDGSLDDVYTDVCGAAAALGALAAWRVARARVARVSLLLLAAIAAATAFWPVTVSLAAYQHRHAIAPSLLEPQTRLGRYFLQRRAIRMTRDPGGGWRITPARALWPGLSVDEVLPDWSGYRALLVDLRNPGDTPLSINVRIDDELNTRRYADRFNIAVQLAPHQRVPFRIPITALDHRISGRNLDIHRIRSVFVYQEPNVNVDPYVLHALRLER